MTRILIIDDEDLFREDLATILGQEGYECRTASNGKDGLEVALQFRPNIVLCDLVMPGISGLEVTARVTETIPDCAVLVISAHATVDKAIGAFRRGALDVILKPLVIEALLNRIHRIEEERKLQSDVRALRIELARCGPDGELIGSSTVMEEIRSLVRKVAVHDTSVLITGESGTGKEVVARMIHEASRFTGPFVAVNCLAVADSLFESELFGHARGAFTGAERAKKGYFEAAQGGTLLLDEVGEISSALQGKLLRTVECHEIIRVGEVSTIPIKVRILAATNRDLQQMVVDGRFRSDLFYRLRVLHIAIPPLRERGDDVVELSHHFLKILARRMHVPNARIDKDALNAMTCYHWPGNVRELKNAIERALIVGRDDVVRVEDLPVEVREGTASLGGAMPENLRAAMRQAERAHILRVLRSGGGNKGEAARRLGIDPSTLWRKLEGKDDGG